MWVNAISHEFTDEFRSSSHSLFLQRRDNGVGKGKVGGLTTC